MSTPSCDHCHAELPCDGRFCDQCGTARPVRPVRMPRVPAAAAGPPPTPAAVAAASTLTSVAPAGVVTAAPAAASTLRLVLVHPAGLTLPPLTIQPGTEIGREVGPFTRALEPFHNRGISRRHCRFDRSSQGAWMVTDLGSTAGTEVGADAAPLKGVTRKVPATPQPCRAGGFVRIGELLFRLEAGA